MADDLADVDIDDKKPVVFDDVREQEPDPDEELNMAGVSQDVWLVKMPKFLLQRWSSVTAGGIPLATIRVYEERDKATGMQRVEILLPEHFNQPGVESPSAAPSPPSGSASQSSNQMMSSEEHQAALARAEAALEEHERSATRFDLEILRPGKHELAENQLVIGNRPKPKDDGTPGRARESFRKGKVKHTCAMQPYMDARYRKIIRDRAQLANMPKRRIIQVNAEDMNSTAEVNNLPSMAEVNASWQPRASKAPVKKGEFERYARMPKNELLDKLFSLFQEEKSHWPLKELRLRTQQPEGYLKEVVTSIAILHRNGEHVGKYSLKPEHLNATGGDPNFFKSEASSSALADGMDEDDDDDDMEEVS